MVLIHRKHKQLILQHLQNFSAVGLIGARQTGKTTLAMDIARSFASVYLDLENPNDRVKLQDPIAYLNLHPQKLIILDEIQLMPEIFKVLRGVIDARRRQGNKFGQFLILGSASIELLKQSSETLAGRIIYVEMSPLILSELKGTGYKLNDLWLRGGFPDSLLAVSDSVSLDWRKAFIKTYLERDIPQLGPRIPAETLRRFWLMLAHCHGGLLNAANLASSLGVSGQTIGRYIDLFVDLFLINRLQPWHINIKKRTIKSPKVYITDSGILHSLLNIATLDDLISNPLLGNSWEGFVIDNIKTIVANNNSEMFFYRTVKGAEIDLLIKHIDGRLIAIEVKFSSAPKLSRGFFEACKDIKPSHRYLVYPGDDNFPLGDDVSVVSLAYLLDLMAIAAKP